MIITVIYTSFILLLGRCMDLNNPKKKKLYLTLSGLILITISGCRTIYYGSGDTFVYANMYDDDFNMSLADIIAFGHKDTYYHCFSKILSYAIGGNFQNALLVFATMYVIPLSYILYKESPNIVVSFVVLFAMGFFNFSMNGIRQGLAIAFILFSYFPLRDKKIIRFVLFVLIASCFHGTAVCFLIVYPFYVLGFNKKTALLYTLLVIVILFYGDALIRQFATEISVYDERFANYAVSERSLTYSGLIQFLLILGLTLYYYKPFSQMNKDSGLLMTLLLLSIMFQAFAVYIAEMFRVAMYFSIFMVLLLPKVLMSIPQSSRKGITVIICSLLCLYFYAYPYKLEYAFFWN